MKADGLNNFLMQLDLNLSQLGVSVTSFHLFTGKAMKVCSLHCITKKGVYEKSTWVKILLFHALFSSAVLFSGTWIPLSKHANSTMDTGNKLGRNQKNAQMDKTTADIICMYIPMSKYVSGF